MIINSEHYNLVNRKDEFLNSKPFPYLQLKNFLQKDFLMISKIPTKKQNQKKQELVSILMLKTKNGLVKIQNYLR